MSMHSHTLLDPTVEEERVCTGKLTVATLSHDQVIAVYKTGIQIVMCLLILLRVYNTTSILGTPNLSAEAILELSQVAQGHASMLTQLVETAMKRSNKSVHPIR